ncbi:NEL-type E3 ubiquitin ligase domain-containing protein [Pseudomonas sp. NPDC086278]|uniref:NEL-type E3 ubiquitin ligase domain-containing protein n=1 Tax=Pseudomonas sp. NPDC086278 TaxID=3390646 RepID=UPI003CFD5223
MQDLSKPANQGLHTPFIKSRLPDWTEHLVRPDLERLTRARDPARLFAQTYPTLYAGALAAWRQALLDAQVRSNTSSQALAKTLKDFKGISEFARPLLEAAMSNTFGQSADVTRTMLFHLRAPNQADEQTLLQAALRNFEADEPFDEVALQETSALAPAGALESELYDQRERYPFGKTRYKIRDKSSIKPDAFARLCRKLDLGKQYQEHLSAVFDSPETSATVREQTIAASKDRLRVQAHIARMKSNINESAYAALLAILDGNPEARLDGRRLAYSQLTVLGSELSEVLIIGPASRKPTSTLEDIAEAFLPVPTFSRSVTPDAKVIVYVPGDPLSPVKEYSSLGAFEKDLAIKLRSRSYQRFFAGLLPQDESASFFRRLKSQLKVQRWNPKPVYPGPPFNPKTFRNGLYELVWNPDVNLALSETFIGSEVFGARYEAHLARAKSNARLLAIPTAEVDHQAWLERLGHWAEWGLNALNVAAFFVPGLGEVMLVVTAVQLSGEVYQGVEAWKEGDAEEAWGHLKSVMENVAFMAAVGAVASKAPPITSSGFVDGMRTITTPFGEPRLWHPDLAAYKSGVALEGLNPNALGQYEVGGKTYINLEGNAYEKAFDPALKQWRIKHPTDPDAYQPVLLHNNLGAWRHSLERPLQWDRLRLLRRIEPQMQAFSDAELEQIASVSGVSDDALRQMHVDHLPPPPRLSETVASFKADRQVTGLIDRLRSGGRLDHAYDWVVNLALELPDWPGEEVLEVFEGPELWGASRRFSSVSTVNSARPTIKITQAEVRAGKLPERVLSALDEPQVIRLLGGRSTAQGADRVQMFRDRLADHGLDKKQSLFDRLRADQQTADTDTRRLTRSFPTLSPEAAREVLAEASAAELSRLHSTGKIPLRQAKAIRVHLQQGTFSRALCGLHLESMASVASDRLALHSLEHLPGWSPDIRVEVRSGSIQGALLDSVGDSGATRFFLVKRDECFQAFDGQGRALNNIPAHGRNLFASLLEVVPQASRARFEGEPVHALQKTLANYASAHRNEMSMVLKQRPINARPSLRLPTGRLGYLASGRGVGFPDSALVSRVRDLYPNLSDEQAEQFVRSRLSAGDSHSQVFNLLANRQREFDGLGTTLNNWVRAGADESARRLLADQLIRCWRNGLYRGLEPAFYLDLRGADPLPELAADFTHVRDVHLNSDQIIGDMSVAVLGQFPKVKKLNIAVSAEDMVALAEKLPELTTITELRLDSASQAYAPQLLRALEGMTQLQQLSLKGDMSLMDFSTLTNLRSLRLAGNLAKWPTGVLGLARLETLDLHGLPIRSLPAELFNGYEPLWRSLQLNWAALERQAFLHAYEYVHDHPAHLVDERQMLAQYCEGRLSDLMPDERTFAQDALARFNADGLAGRTLLDRVEGLQEQHRALNQSLDTWKDNVVQVDGEQMEVHHRERIADTIRDCARDGLRARYATQEPVAGRSWWTVSPINLVLDLTGFGPLGDLPALGDTVFPHIRRLVLRGGGLSTPQVNDFLRGFPQLRTLELSANRLTDIPQAIDALGQLTELYLSLNELTITASAQARLNRLTSLETLYLSHNRIGTLDVGSLTKLRSLDLSHTQTRAWPEGVLSLPDLRRLALNNTAITEIPKAALSGHDRLLQGTSLQGCRLSPQALTAVRAYAQRTGSESPMGIAMAHLSAGRTGGDPEFYPVEAAEQPDLLLPLDLGPGESAVSQTSAARLQRLDPRLGDAEAVEQIDAWLARGMGAGEIEARLVQWHQQQTQLITLLNDWIAVPAVRRRGNWVSAVYRRRAADRLLECWRATLREVPVADGGPGDFALDLSGLVIGDVPALPLTFNHVGVLNLSEVELTQNSTAFLRSFPQLRSLVLNGNGLGNLPEAITQCEHLTRLSARYNSLSSNEPLQRQLRSLTRLQWLDLSENRLSEFDVTGLDQVQSLDLSGNNLVDWPEGTLQAPALTTLDLRTNQITTIPADALQPEHATLMAGTNLFDNLLEEEEFIRLQEYMQNTGRGLGFTNEQIDRVLEGFEPIDSSDTDEEDDHPDHEAPDAQKNRWFAGVAADSEKHPIWNTLMAQDATQDFAYIFSQLRHTHDFAADRAGLTQRVWRVLESAYGDEALSQRLMGLARALRHQVTCGDGRILLFNELEVEVFEFEALKSIAPEHKGRELLQLSRRLFRLAQVEEEAKVRIQLNPRIDPAEIRLAYRTGLAQRLDLPSQPKGMIYENLAKLNAADLEQAYTRIIAREQTPAFVEQLIARKYWRDFLEEKYPAEFSRVQQGFQAKATALEDSFPEFNQTYFLALRTLETANKAERQHLLVELSTREMAALAAQT